MDAGCCVGVLGVEVENTFARHPHEVAAVLHHVSFGGEDRPSPASFYSGSVKMPKGRQPPGIPVTYEAEASDAAMIRVPINRNAAYTSARFMPTSYSIGWTTKRGRDRRLGPGSSQGESHVLWLLTPTLGRAYDVSMIVDNAIYEDGRRAAEPASLQRLTKPAANSRAWLG